MDAGLLILRLAVAVIMTAHGTQKLFGWFGGKGLRGTSAWLEGLGFRPGRPYALIGGLSETGGGFLLAVGLLTPLGAAMVVGVMLVAVATVTWAEGFIGGSELNLIIAASALCLAFTGPGAFSADQILLNTAGGGAVLGTIALAVGLVMGMAALASRRSTGSSTQ